MCAPGKVLTLRGCKHPEPNLELQSCLPLQVMNTYVVYKAVVRRYNRNSGWFDMDCFEDWIITTMTPYFKKLEGGKVPVGDNLASHIFMNIVKELQKHNIDMVFLPVNSTILTQEKPLHVCFQQDGTPCTMSETNTIF